MPITHLHITNVGPFDEIEFEFDHQVNVFTGPNNSGKSSALWALGDIIVYPFVFPDKLLRREQPSKFRIHIAGLERAHIGHLPCRKLHQSSSDPDYEQEYWIDERWKQHIRTFKAIGYSKFIPALRRSTDFRSQGPTPRRRRDVEGDRYLRLREIEAVSRNMIQRTPIDSLEPPEEEDDELRRRSTLVSSNASLVSDEAVIEKIIELDYRSYLKRQPRYSAIIAKIAEITSDITQGFPIEFIGVDEDAEGFFPKFRTVDGSVPLNTLSQGTQSVVQWLAHLLIGYAEYYDFPDRLEEKSGILIIDEIDAHLHVSWQRRVIPTLTRHFPNLQIFCSTHSPLMLAGLKQGQIQLLQRGENGTVTVSTNESDVYSWTADEILRHLMGLPTPADLATSDRIERLHQLRQKGELSTEEADDLEKLRQEVSLDLLRGPTSSEIDQFANELRRARLESASDLAPFPPGPGKESNQRETRQ